jgi:hypothetical protein
VTLDPAVVTVAATDITSGGAILNGANYGCDPVYFEYELYNKNDDLISSHTTDDQAGPGGDGDPFSQSVSLGPAWYKCLFRAVGEVAGVPVYGDWLVFFNPEFDPYVETLPATGITDASATLNGLNHGCDFVHFHYYIYDEDDVLMASASTGIQVGNGGFSQAIVIAGDWRYGNFRAVGTKDGETYFGAILTFHRFVVETLPASNILYTTATLNGAFWGVS